jgi:hypothetical protein
VSGRCLTADDPRVAEHLAWLREYDDRGSVAAYCVGAPITAASRWESRSITRAYNTIIVRSKYLFK